MEDAGVLFPVEQITMPGITDSQDPLAVIRAMPQVAQGFGTTVLLFENLHRFMGSVELIQAVARQAITGKHNRAFIVVLAPVTQIPPELDKLFVCVDHELPDHGQLKKSGLVSIHRWSESFQQLGGLGKMPVGGSGGRVFAVRKWECRSGAGSCAGRLSLP